MSRMQTFVLPTRDQTETARRIAADADSTDELLIVCDSDADPITEAEAEIRAAAGETTVDLSIAGEPDGCSGKCNALATGIEAASGEVIVWTDDDFDHDGWVSAVKRAITDHIDEDCPAVSTVPILLSDGLFARIFEGPSAIGASIGLGLETTVWGGTVAFRRDAVDIEALAADLRRTITDDALLTQRLSDFAGDPRLVRPVYTEGTLSNTLSRNARWVQTARHLDPGGLLFGFGLNLAVTAGVVAAPLVVIPLVTALAAVQYARFGIRRASFLWTVLGYVLGIPLLLHGLLSPEFDWGARRYRWESLYDVTVLDRDEIDETTESIADAAAEPADE